MNNSSRQIIKIITEICDDHAICLKLHFTEWVIQLTAENHDLFIFGYQFPNNDSASAQLCDDKCALSSLLSDNNIKAINHEYFMSPKNKYNYPVQTDWSTIYTMLDKHKTLVCKMNTGTGGNHVYRVDTRKELESSVNTIFNYSDLAVSPYYRIDSEYRIIVLDGHAELVYKKEIPYVIGDGTKTFSELLKSTDCTMTANMPFTEYQKNDVVPKGKKVQISWKHNLALGADALIIDDKNLQDTLSTLAIQAANIIQIHFASVDIVEINNEFYILEINSGIVLEKFSNQSDKHYQISKKIYEKAIFSYFNSCK